MAKEADKTLSALDPMTFRERAAVFSFQFFYAIHEFVKDQRSEPTAIQQTRPSVSAFQIYVVTGHVQGLYLHRSAHAVEENIY